MLKIGNTPEKEFVDWVEKESRTKPYPSRSDASERFKISKDTVDNRAKWGIRQGLIDKKVFEGVTRFYYVEYYKKDYRQQLEEAIDTLKSLLHDFRGPTLEETCRFAGLDPERDVIRENFYKLLKDKGLEEPSEPEIELYKHELRHFIERAVILRNNWSEEHLLTKIDELEQDIENFKQEADDYFDENSEILDEMVVNPVYPDEPSKYPEKVHIKFPKELRPLVGRVQTNVEL